MTVNSKCKIQNSKLKPAAFLWDESFLWGVMAYKALEAGGLCFEFIRSEDIKNGRLKKYALLFVPGGWASNKLRALGDDGIREIKKFVHDGGAYLGFCGGAGLATLDGIGLVNVKRKPTRERVPSFSGKIKLNTSSHPIWEGIPDCGITTTKGERGERTDDSELRTQNSELIFHAWWPSQFVIDDGNVTVLATYGEAMPDSFSSDVNVGDAEASGRWPELERIYQINMDPKRLLGEPAVVEGRCGKGKVVLSLIHFDTPGDPNGALVLKNLWKYLNGDYAIQDAGCTIHVEENPASSIVHRGSVANAAETVSEMEFAVADLINLGLRNFLWFWRNSMLLQWRRGVRGLEYCTLYIMMNEIVEIQRRQKTEGRGQRTDKKLERIRELLLPFVDKAKRLLLLERYALQNGHITYERCDDPEIQSMREELFSRSKSYGGLFKKLIDEIDGFLFSAIVQQNN